MTMQHRRPANPFGARGSGRSMTYSDSRYRGQPSPRGGSRGFLYPATVLALVALVGYGTYSFSMSPVPAGTLTDLKMHAQPLVNAKAVQPVDSLLVTAPDPIVRSVPVTPVVPDTPVVPATTYVHPDDHDQPRVYTPGDSSNTALTGPYMHATDPLVKDAHIPGDLLQDGPVTVGGDSKAGQDGVPHDGNGDSRDPGGDSQDGRVPGGGYSKDGRVPGQGDSKDGHEGAPHDGNGASQDGHVSGPDSGDPPSSLVEKPNTSGNRNTHTGPSQDQSDSSVHHPYVSTEHTGLPPGLSLDGDELDPVTNTTDDDVSNVTSTTTVVAANTTSPTTDLTNVSTTAELLSTGMNDTDQSLKPSLVPSSIAVTNATIKGTPAVVATTNATNQDGVFRLVPTNKNFGLANNTSNSTNSTFVAMHASAPALEPVVTNVTTDATLTLLSSNATVVAISNATGSDATGPMNTTQTNATVASTMPAALRPGNATKIQSNETVAPIATDVATISNLTLANNSSWTAHHNATDNLLAPEMTNTTTVSTNQTANKWPTIVTNQTLASLNVTIAHPSEHANGTVTLFHNATALSVANVTKRPANILHKNATAVGVNATTSMPALDMTNSTKSRLRGSKPIHIPHATEKNASTTVEVAPSVLPQ